MKLKRRRDIRINSWFSGNKIVDDNWLIFSSEDDKSDTIFIYAKNTENNQDLKIKIEKVAEFEEIKEYQEEESESTN